MTSHKELKYQYKQTRMDMGVYQIKNIRNGKLIIGSSSNIRAIMNRNRFVLKYGAHKNRELQNDWNEFGEGGFSMEVMELLEQNEEIESDYSDELAALEEKWLKRLSHRPGIYE